MPEGRLLSSADLQIKIGDKNKEVGNKTKQAREEYAKIALFMFYPLRCLADIKLNESYWKLFFRELQLKQQGDKTIFWDRGFDILQNIQDRLTVDRNLRQARDPLTKITECQVPNGPSTK